MTQKIILPHNHGSGMEKLLENKPEDENFDNVADIFGLVSDATRLKILWLLCHSEDCVANIAAAVEMSSPAVSHHLRILKQSGLIVSRKVGKEVHYTLAETEEAELVHKVVDDAFHMNCFK